MLHVIYSIFILIPFNSYAYFEPGSASVIIQAIIGSIVAVGAYISIYYRKVKDFISKLFKKKK